MKISIALICILAEVVCIYGNPQRENKMKNSAECKTEVGISDIPSGDAVRSHKEKCFIACMMEKEGMMINGKLDFENLKRFNSKLARDYTESDDDVFKQCMDTANKENDKCEVADSMAKCAEEKVDGRRKMHRDIED